MTSCVAHRALKTGITTKPTKRGGAGDPLTAQELTFGRKFINIAQKITLDHRKPIFALKSGRSPQGARAARSHTGSLAGSDAAYAAILGQSGIHRVNTIDELFDYATGFEQQPLLAGRRIAAIHRRAKFLLMELDNGQTLVAHLGMSGGSRLLLLLQSEKVILVLQSDPFLRFFLLLKFTIVQDLKNRNSLTTKF